MNEKKLKNQKNEKNTPLVLEFQVSSSNLHMARRGGEIPYQ
jgi:hypothetical protein